MIELRLKGGKELHDLMQQLPVEVETKILRAALGRGAKILRDEARSLAPVESGAMKKAIKSSRNTKKGQVIAKARIWGCTARYYGPPWRCPADWPQYRWNVCAAPWPRSAAIHAPCLGEQSQGSGRSHY